jgi:hypothetical protein
LFRKRWAIHIFENSWFEIFQVSAPAIERNEERCANFLIHIGENYTAEQLVFVDESGCNRVTTKWTHAWALLGWRARQRDSFVRGQR